MSTRIQAQVTTKNPKGFTYQGFEGADPGEISVVVEFDVPDSFDEASSEDFYGSEKAAVEELKEAWKRRKVNRARPILREAEQTLDWAAIAQQAVDEYRPGRRGGFAPKVSRTELADQFGGTVDIDQLEAYLASKGMKFV